MTAVVRGRPRGRPANSTCRPSVGRDTIKDRHAAHRTPLWIRLTCDLDRQVHCMFPEDLYHPQVRIRTNLCCPRTLKLMAQQRCPTAGHLASCFMGRTCLLVREQQYCGRLVQPHAYRLAMHLQPSKQDKTRHTSTSSNHSWPTALTCLWALG